MNAVWMSNVFIVVNRDNADRNSLADITAAVTEIGSVVTVDEQSHWIEATVPSADLPTISAIEGVSYVRSAFNYLRGGAMPMAA